MTADSVTRCLAWVVERERSPTRIGGAVAGQRSLQAGHSRLPMSCEAKRDASALGRRATKDQRIAAVLDDGRCLPSPLVLET